VNATPRRAIVAFTDTEDVSDDWTWFLHDLRAACAGSGIVVASAAPGADQVAAGPGAPVDIAEFRHRRRGYVFVEDGRAPRFQPYDQARVVLERASEYFGLSLR
jgi:hypothetical protein